MNKSEIVSLLPHGEQMVLIDEVLSWDEDSIVCQTRTHQRNDNPLLEKGRLPTTACLEYGAQAMALHEAILLNQEGANEPEEPLSGVVSALKNVKLSSRDMREVKEALIITAKRMMASSKGAIYRFEVKDGLSVLASGRITVNH